MVEADFHGAAVAIHIDDAVVPLGVGILGGCAKGLEHRNLGHVEMEFASNFLGVAIHHRWFALEVEVVEHDSGVVGILLVEYAVANECHDGKGSQSEAHEASAANEQDVDPAALFLGWQGRSILRRIAHLVVFSC